MTLEENSIQFVHIIISLAILLFAAKLFAENISQAEIACSTW
jgi:hypothetical protein